MGISIRIPANGNAAAKELGFISDPLPDIPTGINIPVRDLNGMQGYDLNGRPVRKPARGIYIIKGRKFSFIR